MTPFKSVQKRSLPHRPSSTLIDDSVTQSSVNSIPSSHYSSDECSRIISSSPSTSVSTTIEGSEDWYGYGVVNSYDEENYLLSLERRAYNLGMNKNGELERHSQDITRHDYLTPYPLRNGLRSSAHVSIASSLNESDDDEDEEDTPFDDYPMRYSMDQVEQKRSWFNGFVGKEVGRHSLDSIHRKPDHFIIGKKTDDHKTGFFSRWAPAWSKK